MEQSEYALYVARSFEVNSRNVGICFGALRYRCTKESDGSFMRVQGGAESNASSILKRFYLEPAVLKKLDSMVIDAGGRVYLGKDFYIDASTFCTMYPLDQWRSMKAKYDPHDVFTSDLGRRVCRV